MNIKEIDPGFSVSDQLNEADLETLAGQGVTLVVNFRPDGEGGEAQPSSATLAAKAAALGMAYGYIPVIPNQINTEHTEQLKSLLENTAGPVIGFCRTGNRANQVYQLAKQSQTAENKPACCSQASEQTGLLNKVKNWFN